MMNIPKICVSILPSNTRELIHDLEHAKKLSADFVEIRFDKLQDYSKALKEVSKVERTIPLIATCRSNNQKHCLNLLSDAVTSGFDYADVDLATDNLQNNLDMLRQYNAKIILSTHNHEKTPDSSQLQSIVDSLHLYQPEICKLVTTATSPADNLKVLKILEDNHDTVPLVCFSMGQLGVWSRILAPFHGAPFTYASLDNGQETGPGQLSITELRQIYSVLQNRE